jgi:hypothetical protein
MIDPRMSLPDTITLKSGSPWSWTWYDEVFKPLFHPRKCDRCKETKDCLGVFIGGTTNYATDVIFGYTQEACEGIIRALRMTSFCQECFNKLRYNGSGVPPTASKIRELWKEEASHE